MGLLAACTTTIDGSGSSRDQPGAPSATFPSSSTTPGSGTPATPGQPAASFADCRHAFRLGALTFPKGRARHLSFTCAQITVPLDYADPTGRTITLAMVRVHDTRDADPTGQLLVNPGGPGASGINLAVGLSAQISAKVLSHFDLIGFDPRGVGYSSPITCIGDKRKDRLNASSPNLRYRAGFAAATATARSVARACTAKYGSALADYNTVETARDMDQIRQAVGDSSLNYLGFSYGTELGSTYAQLFPGKVRVMVLDGAVDPLLGHVAALTQQNAGFEQAFDQFAKYCVRTAPCRSLGNPRTAVYALQARARRAPIPSAQPGETRRATPSLVTTGVLQAMYSRPLWATLGRALVAAREGNSAGLLGLADQYNERYRGTYTNISDVYTTVECNDARTGPSGSSLRATLTSWTRRFPMFAQSNALELFECRQWQPDRTPVPRPSAATRHPVLVVGNLHDPATPYQGAVDLTHTMGNARLLSWNGQGHTSYLEGSTCIDRYVDDYLVAGTLPPKNTTCPA